MESTSVTHAVVARPNKRTKKGFSSRLTTTHGVLYQMDCLDFLPAVRSESVHTVFADPPFNLGKEYSNGFTSQDDTKADEEYLSWSFRWIDECVRILAPGGALFIYSIPRWAYHFAAYLEAYGVRFRHWIALTMKGTYPRGRKLYPAHYSLLYFSKGDPRIFNRIRIPIETCRHCRKEIKDYGGHRGKMNPLGVNLTDFWTDTSPCRHRGWKTRPGVNELKPMIPSRAIAISTAPGDIVLDPFGGGGSTYQEAQRLGRYWIGCELGDCACIEARMRHFDSLSVGRVPPEKVTAVVEASLIGREAPCRK